MPEPLKNLYNAAFFESLTSACEKIIPGFNTQAFLKNIYDEEWDNRELKERLRHITQILRSQLPESYSSCINTILKFIPEFQKNGEESDNFGYIFLPDFVELYGLDHYEISVSAMEKITQFISCEFAVRPFLLKYPDEMILQMQAWSTHRHPAVRRLSSEGFRPRLPWAMGVPFLKEDPAPILPVLEQLKEDESESVRRSVANNLNDISKDHPELVIGIAKKWIGNTDITDRVVKHACRTLLKQGNEEVMSLFGFGSVEDIVVSNFQVQTQSVHIGDYLEFSFNLHNKNTRSRKIRLEYAMYYLKANGTHSKKVFKISEKEYPGDSKTFIERKQSFRPITTKKFYPGTHKVSVIVNGKEFGIADFELI